MDLKYLPFTQQICERLLVLLADKNGEVQNLAVKCLGPLVGKVKGNRVENIVDVLGNNMLSQNEQLRGISTMGENFWKCAFSYTNITL